MSKARIRNVAMKPLWYLLTFLFGAFGALALARSIERLATGAGVLLTQVLIAVVCLILAWTCLKKARSNRQPNQ
jgi:membrane protein DedA with SNARE-associated domain